MIANLKPGYFSFSWVHLAEQTMDVLTHIQMHSAQTLRDQRGFSKSFQVRKKKEEVGFAEKQFSLSILFLFLFLPQLLIVFPFE